MAKGCAVSNNCDTHAWIANWHQSSCASVDPSVTDESMTPQVVAPITNHLEKLKQERKKLRIKSKEKKSQKKKRIGIGKVCNSVIFIQFIKNCLTN